LAKAPEIGTGVSVPVGTGIGESVSTGDGTGLIACRRRGGEGLILNEQGQAGWRSLTGALGLTKIPQGYIGTIFYLF
jgi:hypothetical protein